MGGGVQIFLKEVADFFQQQGIIDRALDGLQRNGGCALLLQGRIAKSREEEPSRATIARGPGRLPTSGALPLWKHEYWSLRNAMNEDFPTFVTHLECSMTGERYEADRVHGLSAAGKPLLVRYDLEALSRAIDKETLARRTGGFWRYREFLPVRRARKCRQPGRSRHTLDTAGAVGAFARSQGRQRYRQGRGTPADGLVQGTRLALAVAMAKGTGLSRLAMPTNGNAGAAMAAYAGRPACRPRSSVPTTRRRSTSQNRTAGRDHLPCQRADQRLRQDRR